MARKLLDELEDAEGSAAPEQVREQPARRLADVV
jgi:hypothetical protein